MIDALDYIPYRVLDRDANYLYAMRYESGTSSLFRLSSVTDEPVTPIRVWPSKWLRALWCSPDHPGTMIARIDADIHKSVDGGLNWGNNAPNFDNGLALYRLGHIGTPAVDCGVLQRGVCWDGDDVYLCEYNINTDRVDGGLNDAVKVIKSTDRGTTWTVAAIWNTDGNHYVRHMHGIQKHGAYLYLSFGDFDYESGILRWDPTQPLASNQPLSAYANCWHGAQRYRTGDILFPPGDFMYWMADASAGGATSPERGVWKGRKDMTGTPVRVDSQINQFNRHSGWYGAILPSGNMVFSEFLETEATGEPIYFYGSDDSGATWAVCGKFGSRVDGRGGAENVFVWGGNLFFSKILQSGKTPSTATVVLRERAYSAAEGARVVHPVYWVARSGEDADADYRGYRPSRPWRSLAHALAGNRVTYGARVLMGAGKYDVAKITPECDANANPPRDVSEIVIEGAPGDSTVIYLDGADSLAEMINSPLAVVRGMRLHTGSLAGLTASKAGPALMLSEPI